MQVLRLETLSEVRDGLLAAQINAELVKIHHDCVERPGLAKPRTLTLQITITPSGESPLEQVDVDFQVKSSIPATKISRQMKAMRGRNGFGFDSDTDSVDHAAGQRRLDGIDDDVEE